MARARFTIEEIKRRLKIISPNIIIKSDEYVNAHTHLVCFCAIDGHEWLATWNNLSKGYGCPKCSGTMKLTLEEVKDRLKELTLDITILSRIYQLFNKIALFLSYLQSRI